MWRWYSVCPGPVPLLPRSPHNELMDGLHQPLCRQSIKVNNTRLLQFRLQSHFPPRCLILSWDPHRESRIEINNHAEFNLLLIIFMWKYKELKLFRFKRVDLAYNYHFETPPCFISWLLFEIFQEEHELEVSVRCELKNVVLLLSKDDYSSKRVINQKFPIMTESGALVQKKFIRSCLDFEL